MIWLQTSTYSCEPTPQSLSPYNHSLGQKFIAIIRDWWYPRKKKKKKLYKGCQNQTHCQLRMAGFDQCPWHRDELHEVFNGWGQSWDILLPALRALGGTTSPQQKTGRKESALHLSGYLQGALTPRNWLYCRRASVITFSSLHNAEQHILSLQVFL